MPPSMAPQMAMPKSPFGGPSGPGASPALSPGHGGGNEAAAAADIKGVIPLLTKHLMSFPIGDKRRQALMNAVRALESNFGKSSEEDLVPAAMQRMAKAAQPGSGLQGHNMPPPGMMLGGPSPMGGSPAGGGGGGLSAPGGM